MLTTKTFPRRAANELADITKTLGLHHDLPPLRSSSVLSSIFRPSPHQSDPRIYLRRQPLVLLSSNSRNPTRICAIFRLFLLLVFVRRALFVDYVFGTRKEKNRERFEFFDKQKLCKISIIFSRRKTEEGSYYSLLGGIVLRKQERPVIDLNRCNDAVLSPMSRRTIGRPRPTSSARFY